MAVISSVYFYENTASEGGAIYAMDSCQITMSNNIIEGYTGSGIDIANYVHLQINNSRFSDNLSSFKGGAIVSGLDCILNVIKTIFHGNKATDSGGGFSGSSTSACFHNCSFTDNSAFKGGALAATDSDIELFTSDFTENTATEGGAFATNGNMILVQCIMSNNTAHGNGGVGYIEENSNINITTSVIRSNSAVHAGGVLWVRKGIVAITHSSIAQNEAGVSAVIDAQFSSVVNISHSTCDRNKVKEQSGSVFIFSRNTKISIQNSKIGNNSADCLMTIDSDSVIDICHSQVNGNYFRTGALCISNNSLCVIMNSSVVGNTGYNTSPIVIIESVTYLENCTLRGNVGTGLIGATIVMFSSDLKLSKTVLLENTVQDMFLENKTQDISYYATSKTKLVNKLHTYRCDFTHGNVTATPDITGFKNISKNPFQDDYDFHTQAILEMKKRNLHQVRIVCYRFQICMLLFCCKHPLFSLIQQLK